MATTMLTILHRHHLLRDDVVVLRLENLIDLEAMNVAVAAVVYPGTTMRMEETIDNGAAAKDQLCNVFCLSVLSCS